MIQIYIYAAIAFVVGFLVAWIIRSISLAKVKKIKKSAEGFLESEKLMKETLQKENVMVHQTKEAMEMEYGKKLKKAEGLIKKLDEDILLLQKSNEETEALLHSKEPALHTLKLKLIEAQNTVARYRSQLDIKQ